MAFRPTTRWTRDTLPISIRCCSKPCAMESTAHPPPPLPRCHLSSVERSLTLCTQHTWSSLGATKSLMSAVPSPVSIFPILLHLCFICDIQAHADTAFATDHSYCDPVQVQDDIARIRLWQEQWNASTTPLFITESGADFAMRWNSPSYRVAT